MYTTISAVVWSSITAGRLSNKFTAVCQCGAVNTVLAELRAQLSHWLGYLIGLLIHQPNLPRSVAVQLKWREPPLMLPYALQEE